MTKPLSPEAKAERLAVRRAAKLTKRFGTTDIHAILGPAGTIPPSQSISKRLQEFGLSPTDASKWSREFIPSELYAILEPYQKALKEESRRVTCEAKYGGPSSLCSRDIRAKGKETCLSKYGVEHAGKSEEVKAKRFATNIAKYGGKNPQHDPTVMAKREATNISRYGGISSFSSPEVRAKALQTNLERYGGSDFKVLSPEHVLERLSMQGLEPLESVTQTSEYYRKHSIKVRCLHCGHEFDTSLQNAGTLRIGDHNFCIDFKSCECQGHKTKLEEYLRDYIRSLGYTCIQQRFDWMGWKEIDCFIPELNIGFEVNGYASHNSDICVLTGGPGKPKDYHYQKSSQCLEHGIKLYHIWHSLDTLSEREASSSFILAVLNGETPEMDGSSCISRDVLPDPTIIGLPYEDLGPQPFTDPDGHTCYTSGLWKFSV